MQTASPTFPPPPPNGYQPLSEAEIYAIKRQYLALLPPQQIIDICLTFEAHAPLHVKSSVWPYDVRAAIASILAQMAQKTLASPESDTPSKISSPHLDTPSGEKTTQPQSSSSQQSTPTSTVSPTTTHPVSQSQIPPTTPGPHYPHQPYYHPPYPHASYYTSPHAPFGYPHPYPSYPQPSPLYPVNPATGHHPPLFTNSPLVHPPHPVSEPPPLLTNIDDIPSYEEMIVEALLDSDDPEGCAPKSLFSWMAMHYPLQTNFRPSASQALQKAFKRGRLEKGTNGKYRLNENWEGGNTSRRTTRRPQTIMQPAYPGPQPPSPFTHAPLVPHGATTLQARPPPPGQPPGYPSGYTYQGSGPTHPSAVRDGSTTASRKRAPDAVDHETGEGSDAWEAAQNILKAINFEQLFQISSEDRAGDPSTSVTVINQPAFADGPDKSLSTLVTVIPEESAGSCLERTGRQTELNAEQRAALQAQLALLAAQLAEIAEVSETELSHNLEISQRIVAVSDSGTQQVVGEAPGLHDEGDDEDNEDMEEVPMPTTSITV